MPTDMIRCAPVIGAICGVIATMDMASQQFLSDLDLLNIYVRERKVPDELALATKEYMHHCRSIFRSSFYTSVFEKLSPKLQGQLAEFEHAQWIKSVSFFNADDGKQAAPDRRTRPHSPLPLFLSPARA